MTAKTPTIVVRVDEENNAEEWWDALRSYDRAHGGRVLESAIESGSVTAEQLEVLQSLPGWSDGPEFARTALVVDQPPEWGLVVEAEGDTGDRARFATESEAVEWAEGLIHAGDWTNEEGKLDGRTITCTYWLTRDGERMPRTYTVDIEG